MMPQPRPFTDEELEEINRAIREHAPQFNKCPLCSTDNWSVAPGFVALTIQPQRTSGSVLLAGGHNLPNLAFSCNTCGYTILMNVYTLGLEKLVGLVRRTEPPKEAK
jgi:hypothetical protein